MHRWRGGGHRKSFFFLKVVRDYDPSTCGNALQSAARVPTLHQVRFLKQKLGHPMTMNGSRINN